MPEVAQLRRGRAGMQTQVCWTSNPVSFPWPLEKELGGLHLPSSPPASPPSAPHQLPWLNSETNRIKMEMSGLVACTYRGQSLGCICLWGMAAPLSPLSSDREGEPWGSGTAPGFSLTNPARAEAGGPAVGGGQDGGSALHRNLAWHLGCCLASVLTLVQA